MQTTKFKENGKWVIIDWDNEGKIGVDLDGKVWKNIDNPTPLRKRITIPNDETFLQPLISHLDLLLLKMQNS